MVWRKSNMHASGVGSTRRRITTGGIILGTDPCTSGGVVGMQRFKLHGHSDGPSGTARINVGEPVAMGYGVGSEETTASNLATAAGNKAKQQEVFNQIQKFLHKGNNSAPPLQRLPSNSNHRVRK
jgi:hypothetical protein